MIATDRTPFPKPSQTRHFSVVLIRFSKREYLEELRAGHFYLNTQNYFLKLENDCVRTDRFETVDEIVQPHDIKSFRLANKELCLAGPLFINFGTRAYNVFCMHSVPIPTVGCPFVDPRNFKFGDAFTVILDAKKFLNRVKRAAKKIGFSMDCHLVEYFDPETYSGEVGPFRKPTNFKYQREFRIIITPGTVEPVRLKVRTLKDITTPIYSLSEINRLVQFVPFVPE
jgi:hypothetical protein